MWHYIQFELKMMLFNKKNWLIGLVILLFFPLYFLQYEKMDVRSLKDMKNTEANQMHRIFDGLTEEIMEDEEGQKIYKNLTEQASRINMQRFYLSRENDAGYVAEGLQLNALRLQMHDLGNPGIHPFYIVPREEIERETIRLQYYQDHQLSIQVDPFLYTNYLPHALEIVSGILFSLIILLFGSSLFQHDDENQSVMASLPFTFQQRVHTKAWIHSFFLIVYVIVGMMLGAVFVTWKKGFGDLQMPLILYTQGKYLALSTLHYVLIVLLGFFLLALFLFYFYSLLLLLTKNSYLSLFIILFILLLPVTLTAIQQTGLIVALLSFSDIFGVLTGQVAEMHAVHWFNYQVVYIGLVSLTFICYVAVIAYQKRKYHIANRHLSVE